MRMSHMLNWLAPPEQPWYWWIPMGFPATWSTNQMPPQKITEARLHYPGFQLHRLVLWRVYPALKQVGDGLFIEFAILE